MKTVISIALLLLAGALFALGLLAARNVYLRRKKSRARRAAPGTPRKWPKFEMTKLVIWVCLANGVAWVWMSYYLALHDKTQIAEGLSQVAVTVIIGVVLAYRIKSVVENLSKNNHWPDKSPWVGGEPPEDEDGRG